MLEKIDCSDSDPAGTAGSQDRWNSFCYDPCQQYEVPRSPFEVVILKVRVVKGRNISNGWPQELFDTPDPYIKLRLKNSPGGKYQTSVIDNNPNPEWNETFTFFLGSVSERNVLKITLMEANPGIFLDQKIGVRTFSLHNRISEYGQWQSEIFGFDGEEGKSEIHIDFHLEKDQTRTLRFSRCLSPAEDDFIRKRKEKVRQALADILGEDDGPKTTDETPTIAVIGSGGGFRAMTGYSGVFKALADSGLLDCVTYACGLSGSSWYLSTLYSHPEWPEMKPGDMQDELMNNIDKSLMRLFDGESIYRYIKMITDKYEKGEPVSFTDFFGIMIGETLLKDRFDCRLTDQREKIKDGDVPMPLYTCVHVKTDVSARSFQEWVEFSPYEIGMPKYGTFMDSELFGSKFFKGRLLKKFEEQPLRSLQGIWGSAFCILFKRLMEDNRDVVSDEMVREEMHQHLLQSNDNDDVSDSGDSSDDSDSDDEEMCCVEKDKKGKKKCKKAKKGGFWRSLLNNILENRYIEMLRTSLGTRAGRAAMIHNFMRGLPLRLINTPFTPYHERVQDEEEFEHIFDMQPTHHKHMCVVDAGLTFNSPYPLVLRPQRGVDIILSFDFSARNSDTTPPFQDLKLAAKWAELNHLPFPPIDESVVDREGMKELYVFRHPTDPDCPVVLHFPLVNIEFRDYKAPGVPRETEERSFADFDIFNKNTPYSTTNFTYSHLDFQRLSQLAEFNTLLNMDQIKQVLAEVTSRKREVIRTPPLLRRSKFRTMKSVDQIRRQRTEKTQ